MITILKDLNEEFFLPNGAKATVEGYKEVEITSETEETTLTSGTNLSSISEEGKVKVIHGIKFLDLPEEEFLEEYLPNFLTFIERTLIDFSAIILDFNLELNLAKSIVISNVIEVVNVNEAEAVLKEIYKRFR